MPDPQSAPVQDGNVNTQLKATSQPSQKAEPTAIPKPPTAQDAMEAFAKTIDTKNTEQYQQFRALHRDYTASLRGENPKFKTEQLDEFARTLKDRAQIDAFYDYQKSVREAVHREKPGNGLILPPRKEETVEVKLQQRPLEAVERDVQRNIYNLELQNEFANVAERHVDEGIKQTNNLIARLRSEGKDEKRRWHSDTRLDKAQEELGKSTVASHSAKVTQNHYDRIVNLASAADNLKDSLKELADNPKLTSNDKDQVATLLARAKHLEKTLEEVRDANGDDKVSRGLRRAGEEIEKAKEHIPRIRIRIGGD